MKEGSIHFHILFGTHGVCPWTSCHFLRILFKIISIIRFGDFGFQFLSIVIGGPSSKDFLSVVHDLGLILGNQTYSQYN